MCPLHFSLLSTRQPSTLLTCAQHSRFSIQVCQTSPQRKPFRPVFYLYHVCSSVNCFLTLSFIHANVKNCYSFPQFPSIPSYAYTTIYQISAMTVGVFLVFCYYRLVLYKHSHGCLLELIRFVSRDLLSGTAKSRR